MKTMPPKSLKQIELADADADKRTYWKGEASSFQSALQLAHTRAEKERMEWRADRDSWEAERDSLLRQIAWLRESRVFVAGAAVGAFLLAIVVAVVSIKGK